jgi:hypothetical protein
MVCYARIKGVQRTRYYILQHFWGTFAAQPWLNLHWQPAVPNSLPSHMSSAMRSLKESNP